MNKFPAKRKSSATFTCSGDVDTLNANFAIKANKLTSLYRDKITPKMLGLICEKHKNIEELGIARTVFEQKDLIMIRDHLNQLKILQITIAKDDHQMVTFLDWLPNLTQLKLKSGGEDGWYGGYNFLNFDIEVHRLVDLELENMAQSNSNLSWYNWFKSFRYLKSLTLTSCYINDWSDLLAQINWLQDLNSLELNDVLCRNGTCDNYSAWSETYSIKVLSRVYLLNKGDVNDDMLEALRKKVDLSESLTLNDMNYYSYSSLEEIKEIIDASKFVN